MDSYCDTFQHVLTAADLSVLGPLNDNYFFLFWQLMSLLQKTYAFLLLVSFPYLTVHMNMKETVSDNSAQNKQIYLQLQHKRYQQENLHLKKHGCMCWFVNTICKYIVAKLLLRMIMKNATDAVS